MPDPNEFRDALLADRLATVAAWLDGGAAVDERLDARGATPLFYACTPAMVSLPLDRGADPTVTVQGGVSTLDAAAREGQLEIARRLLGHSPLLATEERDAQLASFRRHCVLWVPVGEDGNVFLTPLDGGLAVVAVLRAPASGGDSRPDGDYLFLDGGSGAARILGWDGAIAAAPPWNGEPLQELTEPRAELT